MIFAVSIGSDGKEHDLYAAYLPFLLAPGITLPSIEGAVNVNQGSFSLRLEKLQNLYALSSRPFDTEVEAARCLDELSASLLWLSLRFGIGVRFPQKCGEVELYKKPQPIADSGPIADVAHYKGWNAIDGHYDADKAAVLPDHKRLIRWETGNASFVESISVEGFLNCLSEALSFNQLQAVKENDKLKLAIELYAAHRFELSDNAQFITLVSSLEALLPDREIAECSTAALLQAKKAVVEFRDQYQQNSYEWETVNHLLSRMGSLKKEAIGTNLRTYVPSVMSRYPELGNEEEVSETLKNVYTIRSTLLHEGSSDNLEISKSLSFLRSFVPRLLEVLFREVTNTSIVEGESTI